MTRIASAIGDANIIRLASEKARKGVGSILARRRANIIAGAKFNSRGGRRVDGKIAAGGGRGIN